MWVDGSNTTVEKWGGEGNIERMLLKGWAYVGFDGCLLHKSKLFEIGLLDEDCLCMQEWDTHIRLSRICNYKQIKEPLLDYMWGEEDTISFSSQKNLNGQCYVMWHNKKRWKEIEYEAFYARVRSLFFNVNLKHKLLLVKICPRLFIRLPRMVYGRINRK